MSVTSAEEPACSTCETPAITNIIDAKLRDLGGFHVRRVLPSMAKRNVGPFIFVDHMGPAEFPPGDGINVRPHPHIGLATVTYLYEGEILHRDSVGSEQAIVPGDINWMTAGSGIVHSERVSAERRRTGGRLHGLQVWVALPREHEETEPSFFHHPASTIPSGAHGGCQIRVLVGTVFGVTSPVQSLASLFYVDVAMPAGQELEVPLDYAERAVYVAQGTIECGTEQAAPGRMLVFAPGATVRLRSTSDARVMLLGGAPLDAPRHLFWNFVSSSKDRLERAKQDWKQRRFHTIPGDDTEFIPLPE